MNKPKEKRYRAPNSVKNILKQIKLPYDIMQSLSEQGRCTIYYSSTTSETGQREYVKEFCFFDYFDEDDVPFSKVTTELQAALQSYFNTTYPGVRFKVFWGSCDLHINVYVPEDPYYSDEKTREEEKIIFKVLDFFYDKYGMIPKEDYFSNASYDVYELEFSELDARTIEQNHKKIESELERVVPGTSIRYSFSYYIDFGLVPVRAFVRIPWGRKRPSKSTYLQYWKKSRGVLTEEVHRNMRFKLVEEKVYGAKNSRDYYAVDYEVSQDEGDDYSLEYLEDFDSYEDALEYALALAKEYRKEGSETIKNIHIVGNGYKDESRSLATEEHIKTINYRDKKYGWKVTGELPSENHTSYVIHNIMDWDRGYGYNTFRSISQIADACEDYDPEYSAYQYEAAIKKYGLLSKKTKNSRYRWSQ